MPPVLDSSRWHEYGQINAELDALLKAHPEMANLTPRADTAQEARRLMLDIMKQAPKPDMTGIATSKIEIPVRDGSTIPAVVFKSDQGVKEGAPLVVLYHGGGWTIGFPEMQTVDASIFVRRHGAIVLSVDYRLAPEHPFPTPVHDAWDSLQWAAKNASELGADPSKGFIVGGSSAGANMSAVVSHQARDEKLSPPLTGVWLHIPATIAPEVLPEKYKAEFHSYEQNAEAPLLGIEDINYFRDFYAADLSSPLFSPMIWPTGHANLPKTYFAISGMDPLRDDGLLYERELREAGVKTEVEVYPGVPHSFEAYAHLAITQKAVKDREHIFEWLME